MRALEKENLRRLEFKGGHDTLRYKLHAVRDLHDMKGQMARILDHRIGMLKPSAGRRFVTFGSCFAENVAQALRARGAKVYVSFLVEDVNCPYNNRLLLRQLFLGERSAYIDALIQRTGANLEELRREIDGATDIILTLGNVYHFTDPECVCDLERESYEQTVEYLREIISLLRGRGSLYISVSPIPISGYRGAEFDSAMEADCASKSQLRAALQQCGGFTYIPTFEFFRWLPAHQEFSTFGADNGHARHIHREQIDAAMELLCR